MEPARKRVVGRPFVKGDDARRNVTGAQRGRSLTARLRTELEKGTEDGKPGTKGQRMMEVLLTLALAGDLGAIKEVLDRTEGKSVARNESGDPGAFEELADKTTEELREMLKVVS